MLACPTSLFSAQHIASRDLVDAGGIQGARETPAAQQGSQRVTGQTEEDESTQGQAGAVQHAPAVGGWQLLRLHLLGWSRVVKTVGVTQRALPRDQHPTHPDCGAPAGFQASGFLSIKQKVTYVRGFFLAQP